MSITTELVGQRVLVVGGGRDIGFAIAAAAAEAGATSIIGARNGEKAKAAAERIPGAQAVTIDVTDEESIVEALNSVGAVDHIVVTASAHHNVPVTQLDHAKTRSAFEAKVIGPLLLAKHAAKVVPPTGSMILFAGLAAWAPADGYSIMAITNGAVAFAATHLAKEMAPIRVNAISPGIIDSGSWDGLGAAKQDLLAGAKARTFVGRNGNNDDIAGAALWLMGAGFISGETIHVEGGARFS